MSQKKDFIGHDVAAYLSNSRSKENMHIPPTSKEVEELISYLRSKDIDPIIVGSVALITHLKLNSQDLKDHNPTKDLDLFISESPLARLPPPPPGWSRDREAVGVVSWISPKGGYVDFLIAGHCFPGQSKIPKKITKDPEFEKMGCPVADICSLFILKLNSSREKDLLDLLSLSRKVGIPKELKKHTLNEIQRENLSLLQLWLEHS